MRISINICILISASLIFAVLPAGASTVSATSANFKDVFANAKGGDTIMLSGSFGSVALVGKSWSNAVTINAVHAVFTDTLTISNVDGLSFVGGKFGSKTATMRAGRAIGVYGGSNIRFSKAMVYGNGTGTGKGLTFTGTTDVNVSGSNFSGLRSAVGVNGVERVLFSNNKVTAATSDGFDIANSHFVTAQGNRCSASLVSVGSHPDCIQLWSLAGQPVQSDIKLIGNFATGRTQGFTSFDPERGGGLRITMSGNHVDTSYPQGIACYNCVDSIFTGNILTTQAGANFRTVLRVIGGSNNIIAGNIIGAFKAGASADFRMTGPGGWDEALPFDFAAESDALRADLALLHAGLPGLATFVDAAVPGAAGAVPEPLIWAQMLAGLALVGSALRRQRQAA